MTFGLPISCLHCGGTLDVVHSIAHFGTEALAVLECRECRRQWTVACQMRLHAKPASVNARKYRTLAGAA